jgi:hypothetical protein
MLVHLHEMAKTSLHEEQKAATQQTRGVSCHRKTLARHRPTSVRPTRFAANAREVESPASRVRLSAQLWTKAHEIYLINMEKQPVGRLGGALPQMPTASKTKPAAAGVSEHRQPLNHRVTG